MSFRRFQGLKLHGVIRNPEQFLKNPLLSKMKQKFNLL